VSATETPAPATEVVPAAGGVPAHPAPAMLPGEVRPHPQPFQYVMIAVVLCVVTALEVGMYYLEGDLPDQVIIGILLVMALVKFVLVASWYMHLRTDRPIFKRFFTTGVIGAVILYAVVLLTLGVLN
jgi:cytochrome c oxidase subunit 4